MAYWEAVASFVVDGQEVDTVDYLLPFCHVDESKGLMQSVNPWSGISTILYIYLSKVGSIARKLHHVRKISSISAADRDNTCTVQEAHQALLQKARHLEVSVRQHRIPSAGYIEGTDDSLSPVDHFEILARAYQLAILLEIYRMFPELMLCNWELSHSVEVEVEVQGTQQRGSLHGKLNQLAVEILSLIASIPENSGTRAVQTLALIIAGSTLQSSTGVGDHGL